MKKPLAERLRPQTLDEIAGQEHLTGDKGWIRQILTQKTPLSILLWGPPGCGKTTLAKLYAKAFDLPLVSLSAVFHGVSDIKKIIKQGEETPLLSSQTLLFVDEIHRFSRSQQDAFLPFLEDGRLILIGATTENPSFSLNNALLSRLRVLTLNTLDEKALEKILRRYEEKNSPLPLTKEARNALIALSSGDGRHLINMLENIESLPEEKTIDLKSLEKLVQKRAALYDKDQESHYNLISALHKSVRASDPDAALYWLARMLQGGESPAFIARRLVRMATEDIGLADPNALNITLQAWNSFERMGSPEGELSLAEATLYLALAPKSNAVYKAFSSAKQLAEKTGHLDPPKNILNAPTQLMKELGYSKGYQYDHDLENRFSGQQTFPEEMERASFYQPVEIGFEREMAKRMAYFNSLRANQQDSNTNHKK